MMAAARFELGGTRTPEIRLRGKTGLLRQQVTSWMRSAAFVAALSLIGGSASADPTETPWGQIAFVGVGWTQADMRVLIGSTVQNPQNCSFPDSYMVESTTPAAQLLSSALLTAYSLRHQARVIVDGCTTAGRPKIIGVDIQPQ